MSASKMSQDRPPVAIVGAGPTGLSLALGLARIGIRSVLFERKSGTSDYSKAPGIHIRTREVFRDWGIEQRFLDAGVLVSRLTLYRAGGQENPLLSLDFSELSVEADRPGLLILEQGRTEKLLLDAVQESGLCDVRFGAEAVALAAGEDEVILTVRQGGKELTFPALYVAGCDGAGSFVRRAIGLPFEGITYSIRPMLADVRISDGRDALPWPRLHNAADGLTGAIQLEPGVWRIIRLEGGPPEAGDYVPVDELRTRVEEVLGPGPFETVWASRFRIHRRSAPRFRSGRVLLAGDAAHVHSPVGGQGMNSGIQDAHNLAWKLANAVRGGDADRLLDSYDAERRAVVAGSVTRYTDVMTRVFLQAPAAVRVAAFTLMRLMLTVPVFRALMLRRATMLDLGYRRSSLLDPGDRAAGLRLPNPVLRSSDGGGIRLYDALRSGPAILDVADDRPFSTEPPLDNVLRIGRDGFEDESGLIRDMLGGQDGWILVRPDRHVAWARHEREGMKEAAARALGMKAPVNVPSGRAVGHWAGRAS